MRKKAGLFFVFMFLCIMNYLQPLSVSAETLYEPGRTYSLYTTAAYGTNKWVSSDTSIVRIVSYSGQYCTMESLRPGTAYVTIYVHYTKPVWDPVLKIFVLQPFIDNYYTYTIKVRTPQCILTNTALTTTTATFAFDAPTNATSVQMLQSIDNGVTWGAASTAPLNSGATSAVVSGLQPNTKYDFKLSVTGGVRNGDSNTSTITTKANVSGVALDKTQLSIIRGGTNLLTAVVLPTNAENKNVSWTLSNNNLASITPNSNGTATITANETQNGTLTVTVKTVEGGYTASCVINIVDPPPKAPTSLRATEIGDTYIKLAWEAADTAEFYYLYINSRQIGPIRDTKYTIDDLSPQNTNTYYVTACNEGGESSASNQIEARQRNVLAALSVESVSDTSVTLRWKLGSQNTAYTNLKVIEYRELGEFFFTEKFRITTSNIVTYSDFLPDTTYEIRAASEYFDSEIITFKTYPAGIKEGVKTPRASVDSGEVNKGTKVTLTTDTSGAAIYYTTDGTNPTISSVLYTDPITITEDMTLKAVGIKSGLGDSIVIVYNYTVPRPPAYLDINNDGEVNELDLTEFSTSYGMETSDTGFEDERDFNSDGLIDIFDVVRLATEIECQ